MTHLVALPLVLLALLWAAPAAGQRTDESARGDEGGVELDPFTVRAPRESRDLRQDRAASGSVVLPEDFDDAGDDMPDVLDREAGVRVTRLGGPASFSTLSIRGSTSDQVLVVLDGVPLNSAAGGPVDLSRIPLGNLGRIEIYRGVSPLLLGSSAIGGVLSIHTREARERELVLSAGGGSFSAREARVFYAEPLGDWDLAVGLDYAGWAGDFSYVNDKGTRFDESDDERERRRNNRFDQVNLFAKAGVSFADKWRLELLEWFFWRDQGVPGLGQFQTSRSGYEVLDNLAALSLEGADLAGQLDWKLQAGMRFTRSAFVDPNDEIGLAGDDSADDSYAPSLSTSLAWQPVAWWDLTGQLSYRYEHFSPSGQGQSAAASERHALSAGLETGFRWDAADLLFLPSGRLEWADSRLARTEVGSVGASARDHTTQTRWSWRGALVNTSIPDTKLTVSGGRALRLPSLFELFGNSGRVSGNPELDAESAYNVDGGIIYDCSMLPEPYRLRLELYGFYSDVRNLIQFVQTAQGVARAENLDHVRMRGVEAGLRLDLFGHLRLRGNYTWLDAVNVGDIAAREGKHLPLRPASKWYARAEGYVTEIPTVAELALFVDAEWIAGNFLDNANLVSVSSRFYINAGLSVELDFLNTRVSFTAHNLTDERTSDLSGYPLPGRSFHVFVTTRVL